MLSLQDFFYMLKRQWKLLGETSSCWYRITELRGLWHFMITVGKLFLDRLHNQPLEKSFHNVSVGASS